MEGAEPMNLGELYRAYMWDPAFGHLRESFKFVPGVGALGSVMFIGESPGEQEDRKREPFVGPSGLLLRGELQRVDLNYDDFFVTNVLKYRPSLDNRDPTPREIRDSLPYLTEEINAVNPYLIVLLGRIPTRTFYPSLEFRHLRGQTFERKGRKVLVTRHPAAVLYNGDLLSEYRQDIAKIKEVVDGHRNGDIVG